MVVPFIFWMFISLSDCFSFLLFLLGFVNELHHYFPIYLATMCIFYLMWCEVHYHAYELMIDDAIDQYYSVLSTGKIMALFFFFLFTKYSLALCVFFFYCFFCLNFFFLNKLRNVQMTSEKCQNMHRHRTSSQLFIILYFKSSIVYEHMSQPQVAAIVNIYNE